MKEIKFGDNVLFNCEYVSSKPKTIDVNLGIDAVDNFFEEYGIEVLEDINCKKIHTFKKAKRGIFLGITKINLSFYYDYVDSIDTDFGVISARYIAIKNNFIEVGMVKCENIQKTYYVPLNNIREVEDEQGR